MGEPRASTPAARDPPSQIIDEAAPLRANRATCVYAWGARGQGRAPLMRREPPKPVLLGRSTRARKSPRRECLELPARIRRVRRRNGLGGMRGEGGGGGVKCVTNQVEGL